jgi:membrane associated rhomboid family serine protease
MNELKQGFIVHICKYLGVALVAGSIVHAGTLGGHISKYIILICVGTALTVYGNILENNIKHLKMSKVTILLSIVLSFGTGMLSGGVQHFADNPAYGAVLLSLGFFITFIAFGYISFRSTMKRVLIVQIAIISILLYIALSFVVANLIPTHSNYDHHSVQNNTHN